MEDPFSLDFNGVATEPASSEINLNSFFENDQSGKVEGINGQEDSPNENKESNVDGKEIDTLKQEESDLGQRKGELESSDSLKNEIHSPAIEKSALESSSNGLEPQPNVDEATYKPFIPHQESNVSDDGDDYVAADTNIENQNSTQGLQAEEKHPDPYIVNPNSRASTEVDLSNGDRLGSISTEAYLNTQNGLETVPQQVSPSENMDSKIDVQQDVIQNEKETACDVGAPTSSEVNISSETGNNQNPLEEREIIPEPVSPADNVDSKIDVEPGIIQNEKHIAHGVGTSPEENIRVGGGNNEQSISGAAISEDERQDLEDRVSNEHKQVDIAISLEKETDQVPEEKHKTEAHPQSTAENEVSTQYERNMINEEASLSPEIAAQPENDDQDSFEVIQNCVDNSQSKNLEMDKQRSLEVITDLVNTEDSLQKLQLNHGQATVEESEAKLAEEEEEPPQPQPPSPPFIIEGYGDIVQTAKEQKEAKADPEPLSEVLVVEKPMNAEPTEPQAEAIDILPTVAEEPTTNDSYTEAKDDRGTGVELFLEPVEKQVRNGMAHEGEMGSQLEPSHDVGNITLIDGDKQIPSKHIMIEKNTKMAAEINVSKQKTQSDQKTIKSTASNKKNKGSKNPITSKKGRTVKKKITKTLPKSAARKNGRSHRRPAEGKVSSKSMQTGSKYTGNNRPRSVKSTVVVSGKVLRKPKTSTTGKSSHKNRYAGGRGIKKNKVSEAEVIKEKLEEFEDKITAKITEMFKDAISVTESILESIQ